MKVKIMDDKRTDGKKPLSLKPHSPSKGAKPYAKARGHFSEQKRRFSHTGKARSSREESRFESAEQHEAHARHKGFSAFQQRLVLSILRSVLEEHKPLDRAYALWFSKVKLESVEQGFIIRHINAMFSRLSFYAFVSGLKRPSDFERHVQRLLFSYCAEQGWPLPELEGEDGFDRRSLKKKQGEAHNDPLMNQGCPIWLEEMGNKELGERWPAERKALGEPAKRFIRTNTLKTDRDSLAAQLSEEGTVTRQVGGSQVALEVTSNSALFRTKAFREGKFEQQDAGSQKISEFLNPKSGERVIDACAGAGGKTLHLAALMEGKGQLIAMDTEEWKLEDLKKRARRAGAFNIETRLIDTTKVIKRLHDAADKVLIDAPCSGTGVIRRMPDSKWRDGRERMREILFAQEDILERYAPMAKTGGIVVYSTCSIMPSENEKQIEKFLAKHPDEYRFVEDKHIMPSEGFDGFYMAKLERLK